MTVLFGTVEYFEKEIVNHMSNEQLQDLSINKSLEIAYSSTKNDILNVFICSDIIRKDLFKNLEKAYEKVRISMGR
ncbi:hypothetical protein [Halalkalibacter urbisdiaboli]|uniref:hypothetical protein n=1 Tax=Halalkalibacter urbisdiaboli TaxID=1960589 RepID=UPI000B44A939|nr:hypothetical protein [Halalkalibacter urbisdiaboli]